MAVVAHIAALRCDAVLPELLGMKKIVSEDAIRRAFKAIDDGRIEYIEEWDDPKELREEFASSRFLRLLEVLETAAEQSDRQIRDEGI